MPIPKVYVTHENKCHLHENIEYHGTLFDPPSDIIAMICKTMLGYHCLEVRVPVDADKEFTTACLDTLGTIFSLVRDCFLVMYGHLIRFGEMD